MFPSLLASSPQQIPSTALDSAFSSNVNSSQDSENVEMLGRRTLTQTTCLHIQIPQRCREAVEGIARYQINSTSIDRGVNSSPLQLQELHIGKIIEFKHQNIWQRGIYHQTLHKK